MTTWIKVARAHLVGAFNFFFYPWLILGLNFVIANVINAATGGPKNGHSGEVFAIYAAFLAMGVVTVVRWLPFQLSLGVSRRSYFMGVTLLALAISVIDGLVLTLLQGLESATNGWGDGLHFFRVPYLLNGAWYLTWLTSFVLLAVCFVWGMWFGIVYKRWNLFGLMAFIFVQIAALIVGTTIATTSHAWTSIGHFFTTLSVTGLTGLIALLGLFLFTGGLATIRRVTV
ncbi:MAG: ABC transporter permease [Acidimicrobiales bacterium]|jgi:hypothetical protein